MTCPPCSHDCNQGRTCTARRKNAIAAFVAAQIAKMAERLRK